MIQTTTIEAIKSKVEVITTDNERLRNEIRKLISERDNLKDQKRDLSHKVDVLNKRIAVLETAEAVSGAAGDTQAAKARIDKLLREIDKFISFLNK